MSTLCRLSNGCNGNCQFCGRACAGDVTANANIISGDRVKVFDESMICEETEMLMRIKALREHKQINEAAVKPNIIMLTKDDIKAIMNGNNVVIVDNQFVIAVGNVTVEERPQYTVDRTKEEKKEEPVVEEAEEEAEDQSTEEFMKSDDFKDGIKEITEDLEAEQKEKNANYEESSKEDEEPIDWDEIKEEDDGGNVKCNHRFIDGSSAVKDYGEGAYICKICGEIFDEEIEEPIPKVTSNSGDQSKVSDIQEE